MRKERRAMPEQTISVSFLTRLILIDGPFLTLKGSWGAFRINTAYHDAEGTRTYGLHFRQGYARGPISYPPLERKLRLTLFLVLTVNDPRDACFLPGFAAFLREYADASTGGRLHHLELAGEGTKMHVVRTERLGYCLHGQEPVMRDVVPPDMRKSFTFPRPLLCAKPDRRRRSRRWPTFLDVALSKEAKKK